jgi:REP element-mobilizing transposase RayT
MPRPRSHIPQGYSFHITLRSNSRQIVMASLRRDVLLAALKRAQEKLPHRLYRVHLMANHLQLLSQLDDASQVDALD